MESVGPCNRCKRRVHTKERKSIPIVEKQEGESKRVCERVVEKGVYSAIEVTANGAGILCGEERWKEADGAGLPISE